MNILFLGGDKRMSYAAEYLSADHNVFFSNENFPINERFPVIVLPFPLTRDGKTVFSAVSPAIPFDEIPRFAELGAPAPGASAGAPAPGTSAGSPVPVASGASAGSPVADAPADAPGALEPDAPAAVVLAGGSCPRLSEVCGGLSLVNYAASETLTLRNAALTAEAAVSLLIESCDGSLLGSRALILGYGRIARALAARLNPFGCEVTVGARRPETRAEAELNGCKALPFSEINTGDYDYIINTVPAPLLTAEDISHIKPGGIFLELATLPNSPPAPHIKYIHGAGLPGRCSPKTAGKYIAEELSRLIQERTEP